MADLAPSICASGPRAQSLSQRLDAHQNPDHISLTAAAPNSDSPIRSLDISMPLPPALDRVQQTRLWQQSAYLAPPIALIDSGIQSALATHTPSLASRMTGMEDEEADRENGQLEGMDHEDSSCASSLLSGHRPSGPPLAGYRQQQQQSYHPVTELGCNTGSVGGPSGPLSVYPSAPDSSCLMSPATPNTMATTSGHLDNDRGLICSDGLPTHESLISSMPLMDSRGNRLSDLDTDEAASAIPELVKLIKDEDDQVVIYQASMMVFQLSKSEAIDSLIDSREMIACIISALDRTDDPETVRLLAGTLYNLSQTQTGLKAIFAANCVSCLVRLLASPVESVLFYAITTLHNLLLHQDGAKVVVRSTPGCLERMTSLLGKNNVKFLTICTDCLQILAYGHQESKLAILASGGPVELVRILRSYTYEKLLWTTARVLKVLSVCTANKPAIIAAGGMEALGRHLHAQAGARLVLNCLWTLRNLSDAASRLDNLGPLLQVLTQLISTGDHNTVTCAAGILSNLTCNNHANKLAVFRIGGLDALVHAISTGPAAFREDALEPCICALRHLTSRHEEEERARSILVRQLICLPVLARHLHAATASVCPELGLSVSPGLAAYTGHSSGVSSSLGPGQLQLQSLESDIHGPGSQATGGPLTLGTGPHLSSSTSTSTIQSHAHHHHHHHQPLLPQHQQIYPVPPQGPTPSFTSLGSSWSLIKAMVGLIRNLALNLDNHAPMQQSGLVTGLVLLLYATQYEISKALTNSNQNNSSSGYPTIVQNVRLEEIVEGLCGALHIMARDPGTRLLLSKLKAPNLAFSPLVRSDGPALGIFVHLLYAPLDSVQRGAAGLLHEVTQTREGLDSLVCLSAGAQRRLAELARTARSEAVATYASAVLIRLADWSVTSTANASRSGPVGTGPVGTGVSNLDDDDDEEDEEEGEANINPGSLSAIANGTVTTTTATTSSTLARHGAALSSLPNSKDSGLGPPISCLLADSHMEPLNTPPLPMDVVDQGEGVYTNLSGSNCGLSYSHGLSRSPQPRCPVGLSSQISTLDRASGNICASGNGELSLLLLPAPGLTSPLSSTANDDDDLLEVEFVRSPLALVPAPHPQLSSELLQSTCGDDHFTVSGAPDSPVPGSLSAMLGPPPPAYEATLQSGSHHSQQIAQHEQKQHESSVGTQPMVRHTPSYMLTDAVNDSILYSGDEYWCPPAGPLSGCPSTPDDDGYLPSGFCDSICYPRTSPTPSIQPSPLPTSPAQASSVSLPMQSHAHLVTHQHPNQHMHPHSHSHAHRPHHHTHPHHHHHHHHHHYHSQHTSSPSQQHTCSGEEVGYSSASSASKYQVAYSPHQSASRPFGPNQPDYPSTTATSCYSSGSSGSIPLFGTVSPSTGGPPRGSVSHTSRGNPSLSPGGLQCLHNDILPRDASVNSDPVGMMISPATNITPASLPASAQISITTPASSLLATETRLSQHQLHQRPQLIQPQAPSNSSYMSPPDLSSLDSVDSDWLISESLMQ